MRVWDTHVSWSPRPIGPLPLLPDRGSPTLTGWRAPVAQQINRGVGTGLRERGWLELPSHLKKTLIRSKGRAASDGMCPPPPLPSPVARSLDRFRVSVGGCGGSSEPRSPSPHPHLPFMCAVRQGPTNQIRVGLPRSGSRDKGPIGHWAYWWRSTNILPLDLIPSFTFISFAFVHSITD